MKYIAGLGEALWDVLPSGRQIGGAPANFAYHAGQFGRPAYAVSAVGNDDLGNELLARFAEKNLYTLIPQIDFPTGTVDVSLTGDGIPLYDIRQGVAWDNIPTTAALLALANDTIAVCFGSLAQRSDVSRQTIYRFLDAMPDDSRVLKIFDINLRQHYYNREVITASLERCNVLKLNEDELPILVDMLGIGGTDAVTQGRGLMQAFDLRLVILTQGAHGSYVLSATDTSFIETPKVEVADTVGAGDAFTGAFVGSLLQGKTPREAHLTAVRISAYVCTQHGAMPEIPDYLKQ